MSTPSYQRRAFTLIEVVIAILLLSMVLSVMFMGTYSITLSWEQLEREASNFEELLVLDRTIDNMFTNIIPFRWPSEDDELNNREFSVFEGDSQSLLFAYIHRVNRASPLGAEHDWDQNEGGIRFCLMRQEREELVVYYCNRPPFPDRLGSERLTRTVLSRDVRSLAFSFLDLDEEADEMVWVTDWEDRDYLPLAIRLDLGWHDKDREASWLRRTAGSGYFEHLGVREMNQRKNDL